MKYAVYYGLKPGDRIVESLFWTGISKHHAIYLGWDENGVEWMCENAKFIGVRLIRAADYFKNTSRVDRIEKFPGTNAARKIAVQRALKTLGKPYNLIDYNCEHFANDIQHGQPKSDQVAAAFVIALLAICLGFSIKE